MDHTDEKVIIPSPRELEQIEEIDKTKVFWTVVLAIFIVGFVFVLGYWVGQQKSKVNEFHALSSENSLDISNFGSPSQNVPVTPQGDMPPVYEGSNDFDSLDNAASGTSSSAPSTSSRELAQPPLPLNTPSIGDSSVTPPITPPVVQNTSPVKIIPKSKKKPALTTENGKWALRLATVRSEKSAQTLKRKLAGMGYHRVNIVKIGVLYRVSVLGFQTQEQAKTSRKAIGKKFRLTDIMIIKL